jgi:hypothetical protein
MGYGGAGRKALMQQAEASLRRLQTDYIDREWMPTLNLRRDRVGGNAAFDCGCSTLTRMVIAVCVLCIIRWPAT